MMALALRRSGMVSNSGTTISSARAAPSKVPCSSPASFCSNSTSSRSLTLSVWLMMACRMAAAP